MVLPAIGIGPNLDIPKALPACPWTAEASLRGRRPSERWRGFVARGDIAFHQHPLFPRIRVETREVAKNQGRGIGAAIASGPAPYSRLPYFWSDQYDVGLEYRGHASGDDPAVWRGDREGLKFSVFYFRDGLIDGVLSMNDKKTNELGGKLIESRQPVDKAALADTSLDLTELIPAAAS
jgi:3-phenylpropionate/trans-cinnamate dioxygenase ferredoxin reductase subunit